MKSLLTVIALLLIAALSLELRRRWPRLTRRAQTRWLVAICGLLLLKLAADAAKWELTTSRLNDLIVWGRITGYVLLVVLFTRLRPHLLTLLIAIVLLLPLLSATVYLPLEGLFDPSTRKLSSVGDRIYLEQIPWKDSGGDNRGVDYVFAQHSRIVPFLQHDLRVGRLYRTQCDIDAITAHLIGTPRELVLHCPAGAPGDPAVDEEIPLR